MHGARSQYCPPDGTDGMSSARRQDLERKARADVLTAIIGGAITSTFVISSTFGGSGDQAKIPIEHIWGMAFNALLSPTLYFFCKGWYLRHRTPLVVLIRLVFMWGTTFDFLDIPHTTLSWPAFISRMFYGSRALVVSWGCFGWQLPLGYHALIQAAHVAAAARLIAPTCVLPLSPSDAGTFLSLNLDKFKSLITVLDWPFAVVWPPAPLELRAATSPKAACSAVVLWMQIALAWIVPTAVLASSVQVPPTQGLLRTLRENMVLVVCTLVQATWCVIRVLALKLYTE